MKMESMIDRPILNNKDAAEDLLVRMLVLKGDVFPSTMKRQKDLFQSAGIIYKLIENDAVEGKTNNEVYDMYFKIAKELGIPIINKDFLMKALKFYYGFEIVSVRKGKKVVRILMPSDSDYSISHSKVRQYLESFNRSDFLGKQPQWFFNGYQQWCQDNNCSPVSKDVFTRTVRTIHGLNIRIRKKGKQTIKVFSD